MYCGPDYHLLLLIVRSTEVYILYGTTHLIFPLVT